MKKPIVFMFSGQGSQYYQMGKALYDNDPVFRKWMHQLDETARKIMGDSVLGHIYQKPQIPAGEFKRTLYTHPAIFMVEYALAQVLMECGIKPDIVIGSSLGEVTAAAIAGVLGVEETMAAIIKQAQTFESLCPEGGMLAVIHDYNIYHEMPLLYDNSELASVNFQSHFVVSGTINNIKKIYASLSKKSIICQELPVSFAFHSSLVDPAASAYKDYLAQNCRYKVPEIPFVSSLSGKQLDDFPQYYFWDIARAPIRFRDAIQEMESGKDYYYLDLSPFGTLAGFVKQNLKKQSRSECDSIITPFGQEMKQLEKIKNKFSVMIMTQSKGDRKKMITYMFPGQGCQHKGMGDSLFDEFGELTKQADEILGYSIKNLCLKDPDRQLNQTQYTQPALYVVNALTYLKKRKENDQLPNYVAGHSLGEYSALFAAGAFDFATGLRLVKKRGELMSQVSGGGMAAVIGLKHEQIEEIIKTQNLNIEFANYNTPSQIVLSGPKEVIQRIGSLFEEKKANYIPLNVSGAFHSSYMSALAKEFEAFLRSFSFSELSIPVISNVNARPYRQEDIQKNLVDQISSPVKWSESIIYLMRLGDKMEFIEIGPGKVLTNMFKKIKDEAPPAQATVADEKMPEKESAAPSQRKAKNKPAPVSPKKPEVVKEKKADAPKSSIESLKGPIDREPVAVGAISAHSLGNSAFRKDYNLKYAYLVGSMYRGISSEGMVVKVGKAGILGFFGTGGLSLEQIAKGINYIKGELNNGESYGMNLLHNPVFPVAEEATVDLFLKEGIRVIEASAFMAATPALVRYRASGLKRGPDGKVQVLNRIIGKISRPEVAEVLMSPAPERIVQKLLDEGKVSREEADLLKEIPLVEDLCVEADSAGHTDGGNAMVLMPSIMRLRDDMMKKYGYAKTIRVGAAGGIGTPAAAAAAFVLGADFIQTGSINQCTVEAGTSDSVKNLLQQINVQDTDYAPAGDMFELGAKVQVLKRGVFFPARANKLYDIYTHYNSLDELDEKTRTQLQEKFFKRSFNDILSEAKAVYPQQVFEKIVQNPKQKLGAVLKWYFGYSTNLAMNGITENQVDYQVHCGPALGAFNQWVKGSPLEDWRNRHVDEIGEKLMLETAELIDARFKTFYQN